MHHSAERPILQRVIVVVMDGVRADAAALFHLDALGRLAARGASTFRARTVTPSVTAAAMASLFTGVPPHVHGLDSDRFRIPRMRVKLEPVPAVLGDRNIPSFAFLGRVPFAYRPLAGQMARSLGLTEVTCRGDGAAEILDAATGTLETALNGLFVLHWPDADRAGHADGWTSRSYARALRAIDESLGALDAMTGAGSDPGTLLMAVADHGGGGAVATDHDSPHRHDRTIPMVLTGGAVRQCELDSDTTLLDVPATVLWALGSRIPPSYTGRPLIEAFEDPLRRGAMRAARPGHGDRAPAEVAA